MSWLILLAVRRYLLLCLIVVAVPGTCYVHGNHIRMMAKELCVNESSGVDERQQAGDAGRLELQGRDVENDMSEEEWERVQREARKARRQELLNSQVKAIS